MKKSYGLALLMAGILGLSTSPIAGATNDRLLWTFDNSGIGQVFSDESGNEQPGTLSAAPVYVTRNAQGPNGHPLIPSQALSFMNGGGVSDRTLTSTLHRITFNEPFSVSFWLNTAPGEQILFEKSLGNTGITLSIGADRQLTLRLSDQGLNEVLTAPLADFFDRWTHMAIVVFREGVYWYADGVKQDFPAVSDFEMSLEADTPIVIGNATLNIRGAIDEFQLFNRHITATEAACLARDGFECVRPISVTRGQQGVDGRKVTQVALAQGGESLTIDYDNPANIPGLALSETLQGIKGDPGIKGRDGQSIVNIVKAVDPDNHQVSVTLELGYFNNQCMSDRDSQGECPSVCQQSYCVTQQVALGNLHGGVELEQPGDNHNGVGIADIKMGVPGDGQSCDVSGSDAQANTHLCYRLTNSDSYKPVSAERFRGADSGPTQCEMERGIAGQYNIHFKTDADNNILVEIRNGAQVVGVYRRDRSGNVAASALVDIPYEQIKGVVGDITTVAAHDCNVTGNDGAHGTEIASWRGGTIDNKGNLILKKRVANGSESNFTAFQPRDDGDAGKGFEYYYYHRVGDVPSNKTIYYPPQFDHVSEQCKVFVAVPSDYEVDDPFSYPAGLKLNPETNKMEKTIVLNYPGLDVKDLRYVLACSMG